MNVFVAKGHKPDANYDKPEKCISITEIFVSLGV
jgi:hypothetical protein